MPGAKPSPVSLMVSPPLTHPFVGVTWVSAKLHDAVATQTPSQQADPAAQAAPQAPQFAASLVVSTQADPHAVMGALHADPPAPVLVAWLALLADDARLLPHAASATR